MVVLVVALVFPEAGAFTVRVDVQVPPGASVHGFGAGAESVDGNTKLAEVPVSGPTESVNVELVQAVPVSLFVTVAV